jgi:pectinesterase inhibitor-like protein
MAAPNTGTATEDDRHFRGPCMHAAHSHLVSRIYAVPPAPVRVQTQPPAACCSCHPRARTNERPTTMARARALLLVLAAAVALLLAAVPAAEAVKEGNRRAKMKNICKATSYPDVCIKTAGKHVKHYRTVDALSVLEMQVEAFSKRTAAARIRVAMKVRRASPGARKALGLCNRFYLDVEDNLGACRRAIRHRDAVTIRATMGMAAQDMQNCDEQFRQAGEKKNPLERLNQSLSKMSEVCRSLSNMI